MPKLPPQTDDIVVWAEFYIGMGWGVFPVCGPDVKPHTHNRVVCDTSNKDYCKAPLPGTNGVSDAAYDVESFKQQLARWPGANLGGTPPEGTFILDDDEGLLDWLPETWSHVTGREHGAHYWYRQNPDNLVPQGQKPKQPFPGCDTKLPALGYVLLPPSVHASGRRYAVSSMVTPVLWPRERVAFEHKPTRRKAAPKEGNDVITALRRRPDDPDAGDSDMIVIAGAMARYLPNKDLYEAVLDAINARLDDPIDDSGMAKKYSLWDRHQETLTTKADKALSEERRGWLLDREPWGYASPIENKKTDSVEYVPATDFRMVARGVVVSPNYSRRVYIVDCQTSDGNVIEAQKIDTDVLCDNLRLKRWLAKRDMHLFDIPRDPRGGLGVRLLTMLRAQEPERLLARDYYGWCPETQAVITTQGQISVDGLQDYTKVYPEENLATDAPTDYQFQADIQQARDWLGRVLALQPEREAAKVGAWAMMLMLRGQWSGLMPGLLVQASAGTGKTRFFQLLFKLLGSTNDGETLTDATLRDKLVANINGAVWLDDCHLSERQETIMRTALTGGKMSHKVNIGGGWVTTEKTMRASIVVSGEGVNWYTQKAYRDRFVQCAFTKEVRTTDADKLSAENIASGSGALLVEVLKQAVKLPELAALREGVTERDDLARTTLRIGARILDAVLGTGHKWTRILDGWYLSDATEESQGHASEGVLNVFPTLWRRNMHPMHQGSGDMIQPIWFDEVTKCFWINIEAVADTWNQTQRNLDIRARQMTSKDALEKELRACDSPGSKNKYTSVSFGKRKGAKFWQLPVQYSNMVLTLGNYIADQEEDQ